MNSKLKCIKLIRNSWYFRPSFPSNGSKSTPIHISQPYNIISLHLSLLSVVDEDILAGYLSGIRMRIFNTANTKARHLNMVLSQFR